MNIAQLKKLIANLPDDMDVRMYASRADELHVVAAETFVPTSFDNKATLMLLDKDSEFGAGSTVIWDEREGQ